MDVLIDISSAIIECLSLGGIIDKAFTVEAVLLLLVIKAFVNILDK